MTAFDRIERQLPELMTELAAASIPDYFDDLLRDTSRARQRPAWSSLERWLPMAVTARPLPFQPPPWRLIATGVALLLLATAALFYVGSRPPPVPAPFGLARNGQILFNTAEGDILAADPRTGNATLVIDEQETVSDPWYSNDGTKFAFDRYDAGKRALFVANSDGSGLRQLMEPAAAIRWFDWSPDGDRIFISREGDARGVVTIVDADDGTSTTFELDLDLFEGVWRPNSDQLVITGEAQGPEGRTHGYYLVNADGSGLKPIAVSTIAVNEPSLSPDGSKLAYSTWEEGAEGRIHIVDIDSGIETGVDFAPAPASAFTDLGPMFSPDGTKLLVHRSAIDGYTLTILPVDGRGPVVPMGAVHPDMTNGARVRFSPDGTKVLATYQDDGTTWLLDVATGDAEQMTWAIPRDTDATWQRLAP